MMKGVAITMLVVLAMVQFMARSGQAAVTCGQVDSSIAPCISYVTGGGNPPDSCCAGVRNLMAMTPAQADRKAACECLKAAAARYPNLRPDAASNLPQRCGEDCVAYLCCSSYCGSCDDNTAAGALAGGCMQHV
ncbi:hypothetical protein RJ639_035787 [Escallonia herrerae]|uniref:Non-specific lipid-transfer protein n=1 Tax=Escallonia herrerae TaxID=1293975 RepID=A0AA88WNU8_9ASTE|nr:hypothetical protein RJ639_035787 [Escallonia herrerae]